MLFQPSSQFLLNRTVDDVLKCLLIFQHVFSVVVKYIFRYRQHAVLSELSLSHTFSEVLDVSVLNLQAVLLNQVLLDQLIFQILKDLREVLVDLLFRILLVSGKQPAFQ